MYPGELEFTPRFSALCSCFAVVVVVVVAVVMVRDQRREGSQVQSPTTQLPATSWKAWL